MFIKKIVLLLIIFTLFSCADPAVLEDGSDSVMLYSVRDGGLLSYGSPLPVTLSFNEENGDFNTLEIFLYSDDGNMIASETVSKESFEKNVKREVVLPDNLEKGVYHVRFTLLSSGRITEEITRSFFYDKDLYRIINVKSFPPDPVPGEGFTLKTDYTAPEGSNPFFRWSVDGKVVGEGFADEKGNIVTLDSPLGEGIVPVVVEMLPYKPSDRYFKQFVSFFNAETSVFISEKNRQRLNELSGEDSYRILFHFRGDLSDSGFVLSEDGGGNAEISVSGEPEPDFKNSIYGYSFTPSDSVTVPYMAFPFRGSHLSMSTVRARFLPDYEKMFFGDYVLSEYPLLSTASSSGDFRVDIGVSGRNIYYADIKAPYGSFRSTSEYFSYHGNEITDLAVFFYPGLNSTDLVWVVNGVTLKKEKIPFSLSSSDTGGYTRIGGLYALLDEAGIYVRDSDGNDSVESTLFRDYMKKVYNGDFVFADGFDMNGSGDNYAEKGRGVFESGFLKLSPSSEILVCENIALSDPVEIRTEGEAVISVRDSRFNTVFKSSVSSDIPLHFDPSDYKSNGNFNIYLLNDKKREILEIDNILIIRKFIENASE